MRPAFVRRERGTKGKKTEVRKHLVWRQGESWSAREEEIRRTEGVARERDINNYGAGKPYKGIYRTGGGSSRRLRELGDAASMITPGIYVEGSEARKLDILSNGFAIGEWGQML